MRWNSVIEMHNKSVLVPLALLISIGGWFLWNIILAALYHNNKIYFVQEGFFSKFGKNPLWWFTLVLIIISVLAFEIAVISLRTAYRKTDEDVFQELERDLAVRMRFEEASVEFLANGWESKEKGVRVVEDVEGERKKEVEQLVREREVGEILRNRPTGLERMDGLERLESAEEELTMGKGDGGKRRSAVLVEQSNEEAIRKSGDVLNTLNRFKSRSGKKGD